MWFLLFAGLALFLISQFATYSILTYSTGQKDWRQVNSSRASFLLDAIWNYNNPMFSPILKTQYNLLNNATCWNLDTAEFSVPEPYSEFTDYVFGYRSKTDEQYLSPTLANDAIPYDRLKRSPDEKNKVKLPVDTTKIVFSRVVRQNDTIFVNTMVINRARWRAALPKLIDLTLRNTTFDHWFDSSYVVRNNTIKRDQENLVYLEFKSGNNILYAKGIDSLRHNPNNLAAFRSFGNQDTVKVFAHHIYENKSPQESRGIFLLNVFGMILIIGSSISLLKL